MTKAGQELVDGHTTRIAGASNLVDIATIVEEYRRRGWNPIPLTRSEDTPKGRPPHGVTGYHGRYYSDAESATINWCGKNVGLRLPRNVIGVDVDVYRGGDQGIAQLEAEHGPLPRTTMAHNGRGDGSGIRLFAVPEGTTLRIDAGIGVDLIQSCHRYVVAAPSLHPDGRYYSWWDESEEAEVEFPPEVGELPELPWGWITGLAMVKGGRAAQVATSAEVLDFIEAHAEDGWPGAIAGIKDALAAATSRHDTALSVGCWGLREAAAGYYPAERFVEVLRQWWAERLCDDQRRRDGPELDSILAWCVAEVIADPAAVEAKRAVLAEQLQKQAKPTGAELWVPDDVHEPTAAERRAHRGLFIWDLWLNKVAKARSKRVEDLTRADIRQPPRAVAVGEMKPKRLRANLHIGNAIYDLPPLEWIIEETIQANGITVVYGAPKSFKTFVALDMALHIANGRPWRGLKVKQTRVLYVVAEGAPGIGPRARAWCKRFGGTLDEVAWLTVAPDLFSRAEGSDTTELVEICNDYAIGLVIVDTLARAMPGADENSAKDMGYTVANFDQIREEVGCAIVAVHHTGKDQARGMRGSSSLQGALDTSIEVVGDEHAVNARIVDQKNAESARGWWWKPTRQALTDGSSLVLEPTEGLESSGTVRDVNILSQLRLIDAGAGVTRADWLEAVVERQICGATTFKERLKDLAEQKLITNEGTAARARWKLTVEGYRLLRDAVD